jgi:hypothetical protein
MQDDQIERLAEQVATKLAEKIPDELAAYNATELHGDLILIIGNYLRMYLPLLFPVFPSQTFRTT